MVGIVLVSHSKALAEALAAYTKMMAPDARVFAAGGLDDGSFGTSYDLISDAVEQAREPDGAVVIMDMGSAVMTVKMVLEDMDEEDVYMADCPFVEGAVEGTVLAQAGSAAKDIVSALNGVSSQHKF